MMISEGHAIVHFKNEFSVVAEKFALRQHRRFFEISNSEQLKKTIKIIIDQGYISITIGGKIASFTSKVLDIIANADIPISIITASNIYDYDKYLMKVESENIVKINSVGIYDSLNNTNEEQKIKFTESEFRSHDAHLILGHGDYLCMSLGFGILCGKSTETEDIQLIGRVPKCEIDHSCFRKERLGIKNTVILKMKDFKSKFIFANTCAGISLADRKYSDYFASLGVESLKNNCNVYISKYAISDGNREELLIYFSLLKIYKNFSEALYYFNLLTRQYLNKPSLAIMLGDSSYTASFLGNELDYEKDVTNGGKIKIVACTQNKIVLEFIPLKKSKFSIYQIRKDLLTIMDSNSINEWVIISRENVENTCIGMYSHLEHINFIIYSNEHFKQQEIILVKECEIKQKLKDTEFVIEKFEMFNDFIITKNSQEMFENVLTQVYVNMKKIWSIVNGSKLNIEKYSFICRVLQNIENMKINFEVTFMKSLVEASTCSDTHLVLNSSNMIVNYVSNSGTKYSNCYICASKSHETSSIVRGTNRIYYQIICPRCEIYSISTSKDIILEVQLEGYFMTSGILKIRFNINLNRNKKVVLGAVILGTKYQKIFNLENTEQLNRKNFELEYENLNRGLYYMRCIVIQEGNIYISHRQIYIS